MGEREEEKEDPRREDSDLVDVEQEADRVGIEGRQLPNDHEGVQLDLRYDQGDDPSEQWREWNEGPAT
jgi:hypothetical protein